MALTTLNNKKTIRIFRIVFLWLIITIIISIRIIIIFIFIFIIIIIIGFLGFFRKPTGFFGFCFAIEKPQGLPCWEIFAPCYSLPCLSLVRITSKAIATKGGAAENWSISPLLTNKKSVFLSFIESFGRVYSKSAYKTKLFAFYLS